jgi:hypothetical protein
LLGHVRRERSDLQPKLVELLPLAFGLRLLGGLFLTRANAELAGFSRTVISSTLAIRRSDRLLAPDGVRLEIAGGCTMGDRPANSTIVLRGCRLGGQAVEYIRDESTAGKLGRIAARSCVTDWMPTPSDWRTFPSLRIAN